MSEVIVPDALTEGTSDVPVYVSITTLPSRIGLIGPTLVSLANQSMVPERVLLCVPMVSNREGAEYSLPDFIADFHPLLRIIRTDQDYGPGTKLLGALDHVEEDAVLIIADDDMVYSKDFVRDLYRNQTENKGASFSFYAFRSGPFTVGQGADGFSFWVKNLRGIKEFSRIALSSPQVAVVDDLWISAFLFKNGVSVLSLQHELGPGKLVYSKSHEHEQLRGLAGPLARKRALRDARLWLLGTGMFGRRRRFLSGIARLAYKVGRLTGPLVSK